MNRGVRGLLRLNDFDQGNEPRGIPPVRSDDSPRSWQSGGDAMNRNDRGVRCQYRSRRTGLDQVGQYLLLELEFFWCGFGDVVRALDCLREIAGYRNGIRHTCIETIKAQGLRNARTDSR